MNALVLDEHRNRFRSDADFDFFVSLFEEATGGGDMTPVWAKKRHLATLLSPGETRSLVQKRMLQRILEAPSLLDDVTDRLEKDDVVD